MAACAHELRPLPSTQRNSILLSHWLLVRGQPRPAPPHSVGTDTIHLLLSRPVTTIKSGEMGPTQNVKLMHKLIAFHFTLTSKQYL